MAVVIAAAILAAAIPVGLWLWMELDARKWRDRELARRRRRQAWNAWGDELDERRRRSAMAGRRVRWSWGNLGRPGDLYLDDDDEASS